MNWLSNYVRPKIRALVAPREVPDNLWHKCPSCGGMIFHRDLEETLSVCNHCGFHMRLDPEKRIAMLFDEGDYEIIELPKTAVDPLKFRDRKRYIDRLKEAQANTARHDAIMVAFGRMNGIGAVAAVFDFRFLGGSMGVGVGEGFLAAVRLALLQKVPLIVLPSSGGARMQEGILSLMQMPRTVIGVEQLKEAGLPYIVVLTDPTTGGVTASFAMLGDIHIAERGAQIGFAGARVIEDTIREQLPEGFQRAEYLLEHGMVDIVVERKDLRATLVRVLDLLMNKAAGAEVVVLGQGADAKRIGYDAGEGPAAAPNAAAAAAGPAATGVTAAAADKSTAAAAEKPTAAAEKPTAAAAAPDSAAPAPETVIDAAAETDAAVAEAVETTTPAETAGDPAVETNKTDHDKPADRSG